MHRQLLRIICRFFTFAEENKDVRRTSDERSYEKMYQKSRRCGIKCSTCTKHTADRGTGRCNNRAKQAGRRHCTDRLYFGQLF